MRGKEGEPAASLVCPLPGALDTPPPSPPDLDLARFGERAVEQGEQGLVRDVRAQRRGVARVFAQERRVVVAVEQYIGLMMWESIVGVSGAPKSPEWAAHAAAGGAPASPPFLPPLHSSSPHLADFGRLQAGAFEHEDGAPRRGERGRRLGVGGGGLQVAYHEEGGDGRGASCVCGRWARAAAGRRPGGREE